VSGYVDDCVVTVTNLPPTMLSAERTGDSSLALSWPEAYTGWLLQLQTNAPDIGLGTNWVTLLNSAATNQMLMPIDPANGSVFYRLISP
jgi:hypothetical protein